MSLVEGGNLVGNNGIELSADQRWVFVSAWPQKRIVRIPLDGNAPAVSIPVDFLPDNIHRMPDGELIIGGQIGNIAEILQCYPRCAFGWSVVRLNPETLQIEPIVRADAAQSFCSATGAAAVDDEVWVASVFSDRIAIVDQPLTGARHD